MIENCGDAYGQYVDAHLTWMPSADAGKRDRFWAVFKYTFPECVQVNMLPRAWADEVHAERLTMGRASDGWEAISAGAGGDGRVRLAVAAQQLCAIVLAPG